jgi:hypothetical protein
VSGTASALELIWTGIAVAGLLFSGWLAFAGWLDLRAVREAIAEVPPRARIWGPRWYVALSAVVANVALCLVWLGFATIGFIAMRYPPPPPTSEQAASNQWVGWLLIAMEFLLMAVQGWHLFVRGKIEQAVRSQP